MAVLTGTSGNDTLNGSSGADTFVFDTAPGPGNVDTITGFTPGVDRLQFDASVYTELGASGSFTADDARFYSSSYPYPQDVTDHLIYDSDNGNLYYDPDGSLATGDYASQQHPILIATLQGAPALAASDIVVVNGAGGVSRDGASGDDSFVGGSGDDTLYGASGDDTLDGRAGDDVLDGGVGSDYLAGGNGHDTLVGGSDGYYDDQGAVDTMVGGLGNDTYVIGRDVSISPWYDSSSQVELHDGGGTDTIVARSGYWVLGPGFENLVLVNGYGEGGTMGVGNELDNVIRAYSGWYVSSTMDGAGGDDTLIGLDGHDTFRFAAGSGDYGDDSVDGGADSDTLDFTGARSAVTVDFRTGSAAGGGSAGSGSVSFVNVERAIGGDFNDFMVASDAVMADRYGGEHNGAQLTGGAGDDTLLGGLQWDTLIGGAGNDPIRGGDGNDSIEGGLGDDSMAGNAGDDTFNFFAQYVNGQWASLGDDTIDGGVGTDQIFYSGAMSGLTVNFVAGTISGGGLDGAGGVHFTNVEDLWAGMYADRITGGAQANLINGSGGDDTIRGGGGDDTIYLDQYQSSGAGAEQAYGDAGNDTLYGAAGADRLEGGAGNDSLDGSSGRDTLAGGGGQDTLTGSWGRDAFVFDVAPGAASADTITDFATGEDQIRLDAAVMSALGASGTWSTTDGRFHAAAGANAGHDADDRIIYDTSSGNLWYDADGNGAGGARLLANLLGSPSLAASDIAVFDHTAPQGEVVNGTSASDTLVGGAGDDSIFGFAGYDSLHTGGGDDLLDGGADGDSLFSGAGNDTLVGGAGYDTIFLLSSANRYGQDVIDGGSEVDYLQFGTYATRGVVVNLANGTASGGVSGAGNAATITGIESVYGTRFGDRMVGDAADNAFSGYGGNDTLSGFDGDDWIDGGAGSDAVSGGAGDDTLYGSDGAAGDTLQGGTGNDYYQVDPGDTIRIDAGGVDLVVASGSWRLAGSLEHLTVAPADGGTYRGTGNALDNVIEGAGWNGASFLLRGLDGNDSISAYAYGNDTLDGGAGNDTLNGGNGNDVLIGGTGADAFAFSTYPDTAHADRITDFASGVDSIHLDRGAMWALGPGGRFAAGDVRFHAAAGASGGHDTDDRVIFDTSSGRLWYDADGSGTTAAQLIVTLQPGATLAATDIWVDHGTSGAIFEGTSGRDSLAGSAGDDWLIGYAGDDTLGGSGVDTMFGGAGDDLYFVDASADQIVEVQNGGIDEVRSSASYYVLPAWTNDLTLLAGAGSAYGNEIENVITGNAAANYLIGYGGTDTLIGGGGNDTLWGGDAADTFVFNVAPGTANAVQLPDFVSGSDELLFDSDAMTALGPAGEFTAGDARFYAAAGANGGHDADDRIVFNTTTGQIWYDADGSGAGSAQLIATLVNPYSGQPYGLDATDIVVDAPTPGLTVNGTAGNDSLAGGSGNDTLNGFGGNDTLDGGAGADRMVGGAGNDVYIVDNGADAVVEAENGGIDEVRASTSYALPDWVNNLVLLPGASSATGNAIENRISGNAQANLLYGGDGPDTLLGNGGQDTLSGGAGQDAYVWAHYGAANADVVTSFDTAWDSLQLENAAFTSLGAAGRFSSGDGRFHAAAGASGGHDADDRIVYDTSTGQLYYDADGSGAGAAELVATIEGAPTVTAADIWVI